MRVHNRFGGMRDLANFCGDIRDGSWRQEREAGVSIATGSGILCFEEVGMRESQGGSSGIQYFNFYKTAWSDQRRLLEMDRLWMKCVGFQVMNWSRKSSLHVKLLWVLLGCFVLISGRGIKSHVVLHFLALSAFLTFPTLSIEPLLEQLWTPMATPAGGKVTAVAKNEVFADINFVAIYYVKSASRNAFLRKKNIS